MAAEIEQVPTSSVEVLEGTFAPAPVAPSENPALVYLARLAPSGRASQRQGLERIAEILAGHPVPFEVFPWSAVRYQHTAAVREALAERYRPATVNAYLTALRGVLNEAWNLGQLGSEDLARALKVKGVKNEVLPAGRVLSIGETRALFETCSGASPGDVRDAALLAVLYGAGLRRAEVASLELADYDPTTGQLSVRKGKGRKERLVWLANGGAATIADWLALRGDWPGPFFCPVTQTGEILRRGVTTQTVYEALKMRARKAGIRSFSPHDLRRTFITEIIELDNGGLGQAQKLAGHASVVTTTRYDRRGDESRKKLVGARHVPYYRAGQDDPQARLPIDVQKTPRKRAPRKTTTASSNPTTDATS